MMKTKPCVTHLRQTEKQMHALFKELVDVRLADFDFRCRLLLAKAVYMCYVPLSYITYL